MVAFAADLPGQESFLPPESAEDFRARLARARSNWTEARVARAEFMRKAKTFKRAEEIALAEFLKVTADPEADRILASLPSGLVAAPEAETVATARNARRERVRLAAVKALFGCGGHLSNRELAPMIGADPHGLASIIEGDPRIEKFHGGREKNEQTHWRLTAAGHEWITANSRGAAVLN
jgi:hypothetical protein